MSGILQNEAVNELREVGVRLVDSSGSPVSGISGTAVVKVAKPGANLVAATGTLTEVTGGASGGGYRYRFAAAEVDTVGDVQLEITHASIVPFYDGIDVYPAHRALEYAANWITAAKLDPDVTTELQSGLATAAQVNRVLFLMHDNSMIDNVSYGAQGVITSARVRGFADATALGAAVAGHADNADGETFRATISAVDAGSGQFSSYKIARSL
jgi:hypothetical protein